MLADVPELQAVLQSRLTYKVRRRIESPVLPNGDGVGQNLLGLLNQTGIGSVPNDPGIPLSDLILKGKTLVLMSDAVPSGIVMHPYTHEALLTTKTSTGERLDSDGCFSSDGQVMWDLPIIDSKVVPETSASSVTSRWPARCSCARASTSAPRTPTRTTSYEIA